MKIKARWCRFYTGIQDDACQKEVRYDSFNKGSRIGMVHELPCLARNKEAKECKYREFPTDAEVEAEDAEMKKHIVGMDKAIQIIKKKHSTYKGEKDYGGTIECPLCGNRLHYSVSAYNGHIWGQCKTSNCLSWMQ